MYEFPVTERLPLRYSTPTPSRADEYSLASSEKHLYTFHIPPPLALTIYFQELLQSLQIVPEFSNSLESLVLT